MNTRAQQLTAITLVINAIVDTVNESGDTGAPAGVLYAALMHYGIQLDHFEDIMLALVETGKIRQSGHIYYPA